MSMCLAASLLRAGCVVIAADQRYTFQFKTGASTHSDHGGKLRRLGSGWMAFAGADAMLCSVAVDALAGVDAGDFSAVSRELAALAPTAHATIQARWPGAPIGPPERNVYMIAAGGRVAAVAWDGRIVRLPDANTLIVGFPPGFPDPASTQTLCDQEHDRLTAELDRAASPWEAIRTVAACFADVAQRAESVSPTIELGLGDSYLAGDSRELATATDSDLRNALRDPPPPLSDPFTVLLQ